MEGKAVSNRDVETVKYLDEHENIAVLLNDSNRTVAWNLNQDKHIDHAYAMTSHSSQGATPDHSKVLAALVHHAPMVDVGMLPGAVATGLCDFAFDRIWC